MTEETTSARTTMDASAEQVFDVLADPSKHASIDGTGWVSEAVDRARVTEEGQVFRMAMYHPKHPDKHYEMANVVTRFDRPRSIAWTPGSESGDTGELDVGGWSWRYDLEPVAGGRVEVLLTYDWSGATPEARQNVSFPPFGPEHLPNSLAHLTELVVGSTSDA